MPSTKTKYNCAWEKDYPWLKECEKDPYIAQCSFCKSNFKISISGIGQVKAHAAGKKHQNIVAVRKNETNQSVFLSTTKNNVNQLTLSSANGLRLTNMSAPAVADTGQDMELNCRFDMESEELYAVKWYKDDQEFFRYMPLQQPHIMVFPVSGVHLALEGTDCDRVHCKVRLIKLTRHHSDGAYRCEVSSEAPTFRLAAETHNITVATLPKEKLRIEGLEESYNEGDIVSASCASSLSDPAALVTWFINNRQAPRNFIEESKSSDNDGLPFRSVSLRFQVNDKYTQGNSGIVELRCVSALPGIPLPPQEASRSIFLKVPKPQVVSNQKLHWLNSATVRSSHHQFWIVLFLMTVVRW